MISRVYLLWKRVADICLAVLLILTLFPLLLVCPLLSFWEIRLFPIYCSTRVGIHGKRFTMYKIRSMTRSTNASLYSFANDTRIPYFCRIMREFSLDELPQLINILKGDMSFVGPRPCCVGEIETELGDNIDFASFRNLVKPGLTGLSQVNGRSSLKWKDKLYFDRLYIEELKRHPFKTDLRIIGLTFSALMRREVYDTY